MGDSSHFRLVLGAILFAFSILAPLAGIPIITVLGLSAAKTASISGVLLVSAEVIGVISIAIMGKDGYVWMKERVFGFFKRYGPPRKVSRLRYRIGLVMFFGPILFGWISVYIADVLPGFRSNLILYGVCGDAVLLAGLFVLGGDFWDKIRQLFSHRNESTAEMDGSGSPATAVKA